MKLKNIVRAYFTLNKRETREILVLAFIVLMIILLSFLADTFVDNDNLTLSKEDSLEIESFLAGLEESEEAPYLNRLDQFIVKMYDTIQLFTFDPNITTLEEFKKLGLTEKQAGNVISYRQKGGKFFEKDDFRKIYSIRHKQYQILEPYIQIAPIAGNHESKKNIENMPKFVFNPNTISLDSLKLLGISEYTSKNIVNYRQKVGAFKKKSDLLKVYGMDSSGYVLLETYIDLPDEFVEKPSSTELNLLTAKELMNFFEIPAALAYRIINYRTKLGGFASENQLFEVYEPDSALMQKLSKKVQINPQLITKVNINDSSAILKKHPYISYKNISRIEQYKLQKNRFNTLDDIRSSGVFLPTEWKKIEPYLKVK